MIKFFSIEIKDKYIIFNFFGIKFTIKNKMYYYNDICDRLSILEKNLNLRLYHFSNELRNLDLRNKARLSIFSFNDKIIREIRNEKLIISLTTYPERISDIDVVLFSLVNQSIKADKIILWLSNEEFPNGYDDIPSHILRFIKLGVEIKFCNNIFSYKKLIFALKEYPDDIIVTADDDVYYPYNWLEKLYIAYLKDPHSIHCHRAFRIQIDENYNILPITKWQEYGVLDTNKDNIHKSYRNYFTGVGGVLYKSEFLYKDIFNEALFMELAPTEDDKWFFAMALLNNTKINVVDNNIPNIIDIGYSYYSRLYDINKTGVNYKTFLRILDYYGDKLKDKIIKDDI